jgi:hypothetical protein
LNPSATRRSFVRMLAGLPFVGGLAAGSPSGPLPVEVEPVALRPVIPMVHATPEQSQWFADRLAELATLAKEQGRLLEEADALHEEHWDYQESQGYPYKSGWKRPDADPEGSRLWSAYCEKTHEARGMDDPRSDILLQIKDAIVKTLEEHDIEPPADYATLYAFIGRQMAGVVAGGSTFVLAISTWPCEGSMDPGTWGDCEIVII